MSMILLLKNTGGGWYLSGLVPWFGVPTRDRSNAFFPVGTRVSGPDGSCLLDRLCDAIPCFYEVIERLRTIPYVAVFGCLAEDFGDSHLWPGQTQEWLLLRNSACILTSKWLLSSGGESLVARLAMI